MSKLKVLSYSVSIDGFGAAPHQSMENPMGIGGMSLHGWVLPTKTFRVMHSEMLGGGETEGTTGVDDDFAAKGFENIGAWILGRNMFGPMRGPWEDHSWKGWWGDNPPYHTPVYILTHHARPSIEMEGGTTFHFITDGIEAALKMAKANANGKDIRLGGGANTVRQYLSSRLVDEMHIAVSPTLLGSGESLWRDINLVELGYECVEYVPSEKAVHLVFKQNKKF
ncbi:MAG: dihydrofolate reductase family protein [Ignavibacteria bacterium]|nr:dihydrofolate reductase family protein [Ignavibacteria bacterium]